MRTTEVRSRARAMLRTFVEQNPSINQVIVTVRHGGRYIVAWPWRPVLRTALRATIAPEEPDSLNASIQASDYKIIPIRSGLLVVIPVNHELELRVAAPRGCDVDRVKRRIEPIVRCIAQMHDLT
jgi:hypothetical protein